MISLPLSGMVCLWKDYDCNPWPSWTHESLFGPTWVLEHTRKAIQRHQELLYLRINRESILFSLPELRIDLPLWICNLEMAEWGVGVGVTFHMVGDAHASFTGKCTHGKKKTSNSQLGFSDVWVSAHPPGGQPTGWSPLLEASWLHISLAMWLAGCPEASREMKALSVLHWQRAQWRSDNMTL